MRRSAIAAVWGLSPRMDLLIGSVCRDSTARPFSRLCSMRKRVDILPFGPREITGYAAIIGLFSHFIFGWLFAFFYGQIFATLDFHSWWLGIIIGFVHALFLNITVLPVLPHVHPRMANEHDGPMPTRMLEPPGFMGINYGRRTPLISIVAHMTFGFIIGAFYGSTL